MRSSKLNSIVFLRRQARSSPHIIIRNASSRVATSLQGKPYRIGIIGGGPAGFYSATRLLSLAGSENTSVDLFELLPTPFGLSRFGVAPDHPEVKNCEHKFEETARDPRFTYYGNVQISDEIPLPSTSTSTSSPSSPSTLVPNLTASPYASQITLSSLKPHYDALILTYGASLDRSLNIPGETTLLNVFSARSFVNWYNGHPYHSSLLSPLIDLSQVEKVSIIGQGNVAIDVARLLLKDVDELKEFDLPDYVLAELSRSRVKKVEIVGRRGPLQLACTTKEIREMMALKGVGFEMNEELLKGAVEEVEKNPGMLMGRMRKRLMGLLSKGSETNLIDSKKSWSLDFLNSPTRLLPHETGDSLFTSAGPSKVTGIEYELNQLVAPSNFTGDPSEMSARGTGIKIAKETDMVLKSVGYRSIGLPGLPFDEKKGIVLNEGGRVVSHQGSIIRGLYTSGWLARGPNGVIATTMFDAFSTADLVAEDLSSQISSSTEMRPPLPIESLRGDRRIISWEDWERIDAEERNRGRDKGKVREKMTDVGEMLEFLN